jgi:hypothetical protein
MRITREGRHKIHLDQCAYLKTVLERCGMTNAKAAITPLPAGYMPEPAESGYSHRSGVTKQVPNRNWFLAVSNARH